MLQICQSMQATYIVQVNFMALHMLKVWGSSTSTMADLTQEQSGMEDTKPLEQWAKQLAVEAKSDQPLWAQRKILLVWSDASWEELAKLTWQDNPEEMEMGKREDEDEMNLQPNEEHLEQQSMLPKLLQRKTDTYLTLPPLQ